jgi:hypothetical protein
VAEVQEDWGGGNGNGSLVWCVADNYSIAGRRVAAAFRPPPVRVALKGDATSRSAETTEETTKDIHHCQGPLDAPD